MRADDLILKKRNGGILSAQEIKFFVEGFHQGLIPDYQMAALAMAIYFRGLNEAETVHWTRAMIDSGDQIDLSSLGNLVVDKHSTGGVGDTTTLVLVPLVASAGVPVAKISGRGLGHTGGTVDKLEAIPGFQTSLDIKTFLNNVQSCGAAITSQTGNLVPADRKLYALRDVTATVDSLPLIAGSVMSKKIASGAGAIILDVKTGQGAFAKSVEKAYALSRLMVKIGSELGRKTVAMITQMKQPLGYAVGNALEVREALEILKGYGPEDLRELCLILGTQMLLLAGKFKEQEKARQKLEKNMETGVALEKFQEIICAQGGREEVVEDYNLLPRASLVETVASLQTGYVEHIDAEEVGRASVLLGAGREKKNDAIDPAAGVVLKKKVGDMVAVGEILAEIHGNRKEKVELVRKNFFSVFHISEVMPPDLPLIYGIVTE